MTAVSIANEHVRIHDALNDATIVDDLVNEYAARLQSARLRSDRRAAEALAGLLYDAREVRDALQH